MYALIYDDHNLDQIKKKVISVHGTRDGSDKALIQRQNKLGRKVYECNTRIVWTDKAVAVDDVLETGEFVTWHPDEDIPEGELNSDSD
ncbi:hypothetical protein [Desulfobacula sp.]|uniref:hypothetical protein n=1 Tax=Desulfobacula sp. TaxID=2593537 RepID=UPI0025C1FCD0|nr:hypothetical protein [Desulfobacula sp.]MBC2704451.1 hypothetical protein [Desulfobacula sp.]